MLIGSTYIHVPLLQEEFVNLEPGYQSSPHVSIGYFPDVGAASAAQEMFLNAPLLWALPDTM
jgi:hypothetical protein